MFVASKYVYKNISLNFGIDYWYQCKPFIKNFVIFVIFLDDSLRSIEPAKSAKWRKYLQIKMNIYLAYVSFSVDSQYIVLL